MKKMLLTLMLILPAFCAEAKIVTVDDGGVGADFSRIQDAIDDTGTANGDTIKVKQGTYSENIRFNGKAVRVTSWDPDDQSVVEATIITADSDYAVRFDFGETSGAVITGFTITGRGIYCNAASPTISKNIITNCTNNAITGENYSAPLILGNTITSNGPAGVWECHGLISGNIITHNGDAGALHFCTGDIIGNEITNNVTTGDGGALYQCIGRIMGNVIKDNFAALTGGAIYAGGSTITNNVISGNTAWGPGGGLSVTGGYIHHNIIAGNRGSSGGGAYNCSANFHNNTVVGNRADEGGAFWRCVGTIQNNIIAFNDADDAGGILGTSSNAYNCFWQNAAGHFGQGAFAGTGDFIADPRFVQPGSWDPNGTPANPQDDFWIDGDYHLLAKNGRWNTDFDIWVTDYTTSPCIDAGNPDADWTAEYWRHGGLINLGRYGGTAQASMSLSDVGNVADLNLDGLVDFRDLTLFSTVWPWRLPLLREDLDRDGDVDSADYAILIANWQPLPLPTPNPMTWAVEPAPDSPTSITMTASDANSSDATGVQYYFQETSGNPGGDDSAWQTQSTYTDTGLTAGMVYSYRVKVRNNGNHLETEFSVVRSATTLSPPNPDPMTWATPPAASADDIITMTAATAISTDGSGVEYRFDETSGNLGATDSEWQSSPTYTDTGLSGQTTYCYQVKARNKDNLLETQFSEQACATTDPAPAPSPVTWIIEPVATSATSITMSAVSTPGDGSTVEYLFQREGGLPGTWQSSQTYTNTGLTKLTQYCYKVKARNTGNHRETNWSDLRCATTPCDDTTAPYFALGYWDVQPCECMHGSNMLWYAEMRAAEATDDSDYLEYFFECIPDSSKSSGWQTVRCYKVLLGRENQGFKFRVKARDACGNETPWSSQVLLDRCYPNGSCPTDLCDY